MARSVVATDNFNRADGALGANWSEAATAYTDNLPVILSNEVKSGGEGSYDNAVFWNANSFANAQYSKAKISAMPGSGTSLFGTIVRANASDYCLCQYKRDSGSNKNRLYWFNAGAYTAIAQQNTTTFATNDTIEIEADGTTYTMYKNGVSILSGSNGSAPSTGSAGITLYDLDERLDDWEGGDLVSGDTTISVSESVSVAESKVLSLVSFVNKTESISVTESVTRLVTSFINKSESVSVAESVKLLVTSFINKADSVSVSESQSVILPDALAVNKTESISVAENVSVLLASDNLSIGVSDSISITESKSVALDSSLTSSFYDSYEDNTILAETYDVVDTAQVMERNEMVDITSTASTNYYYMMTVGRFSLLGSYVFQELVDAGDQSLSSWQVFPVAVQQDEDNKYRWYISDNTIYAQKRVGGSSSDVASGAYDAGSHRWFKIRESSGTIFYDVSEDGIVWNNFASTVASFSPSNVSFGLIAGTWQVEGSTTTAVFDNLNFSANVAINVSDSISITEGVVTDLTVSISESESISVAESVALTLPDPISINISESIAIAESVSCSVYLSVAVSEAMSISESVALSITKATALSISVNEQISATEATTAFITPLHVTVSDSIGVSEAVTVEAGDEYSISVSDSISLTESSNVEVVINLNRVDTVVVEEFVSVSKAFFDISVSDEVLVLLEQIQMTSDSPISVSDNILVSESVSTFHQLRRRSGLDTVKPKVHINVKKPSIQIGFIK